VVEKMTYAFLANFVPVNKSHKGLTQAHTAVVAPIDEGQFVQRVAVDRIILRVDHAHRQLVETVDLKFDGLTAVLEMKDFQGGLAVDFVGLSGQIRGI